MPCTQRLLAGIFAPAGWVLSALDRLFSCPRCSCSGTGVGAIWRKSPTWSISLSETVSPLPKTARRFYAFSMSLSEKIRQEIQSRKLSMRRIHIETGLDRSTIRRFINTGAGNITTLDAIAEFLGASVTIPEPPAKKPADKKSK